MPSPKKYSKEFKEDALRVAEREGVEKASEKLGIRKSQIYEWRRKKRDREKESPKGLKVGETLEEYSKRLERECEELHEANTILKKAMGFLVGR
jgi:transposase